MIAEINSNAAPDDCVEDENVVISSLVVETAEGYTQAVADKLSTMTGVEVHEINGCRVVVTIEAPTVDDSADIASAFIQITGVLGINLVYCNFEDDPTLYPEYLKVQEQAEVNTDVAAAEDTAVQ